MPKLKAYTIGVNHLRGPDVHQSLGLPAHADQAEVLIVAASRMGAVRLLEACRLGVTFNDPKFRVTTSRRASALRDAGMFNQPTILVMPVTGGGANTVVRVSAAELPERLGRLEYESGAWRFVPANLEATTEPEED